MADGFDIVAGAQLDGGIVKCPHGVVVDGREGEVRLPIRTGAGAFGDPETGVTFRAVADGLTEIHLP